MSAAGPPQGTRPPGGAARSAVRGVHTSAAGSAAAKLARALTIARTEGPRALVVKTLSELGCRREVWRLERDLAEPIVEARPGVALTIDPIGCEQLDRYAALRGAASMDNAQRRLAAGARCYLASHDNRPVASCWTTTRSTHNAFLDCEVPVRDDEAYLFDAFTDPQWRGLGIAPAVCVRQLQDCRAAGLARAFRYTVTFNTTAIRAHRKSGFRPVARIGRIALGPWRHYYERTN
jgi:GNAT superfamily N-acetyltransferase